MYMSQITDGVEVGVCDVTVFKMTLTSFRVYTKDAPEIGRLVFDINTFQSRGCTHYRVHHSREEFTEKAELERLKTLIHAELDKRRHPVTKLEDILSNLLDN